MAGHACCTPDSGHSHLNRPLFPITDLLEGPPVRLRLTHSGHAGQCHFELFQLIQQRLRVLQVGSVEAPDARLSAKFNVLLLTIHLLPPWPARLAPGRGVRCARPRRRPVVFVTAGKGKPRLARFRGGMRRHSKKCRAFHGPAKREDGVVKCRGICGSVLRSCIAPCDKVGWGTTVEARSSIELGSPV